MRPITYYYVLSTLVWHVLSFSTGHSQATATNLEAPKTPVRIAVMPFCDESTDVNPPSRPDAQKLYNYTISALKVMDQCSKPVEWISKNKTGKMIASYISQVEDRSQLSSSCDYYLTESVCQDINADIIVLGEYLVDADNSIEVYYSFENCEGIYTSGIKYLTNQPIKGSTDDLPALYEKVSRAIQGDLQSFLSCKTQKTRVELNSRLEDGIALYQSGESSMLNYLKAIKVFEELITSKHSVQEASYHLGLVYFTLEEYEKADSLFSLIGDFEQAKAYKQFCQLKSRPAFWYNSPDKKRVWWNELNNQWKTALSTQVLNISNGTQPSDHQLDSLFSMTSLNIKGIFLPDLVPIQALSNLTQLSCEKTELQNLNGIDKLINLGQISINNNKITSLSEISKLPLLTRIYCRNNPLESLEGVEKMNTNRSVIFCGGSVQGKEMKRIRAFGIKVQP